MPSIDERAAVYDHIARHRHHRGPFAVDVSWTTGSNGAKEGISLDCTAPVASTLYTAPAGTFCRRRELRLGRQRPQGQRLPGDPAGERRQRRHQRGRSRFAAHRSQHGAAATATARRIAFTATAAACPADLPTPASAAPISPSRPTCRAPPSSTRRRPAGLVLHLPFEDGPDQQGNLSFRDVSGNGNNGACSGTTCPVSGQVGHIGNAAHLRWH